MLTRSLPTICLLSIGLCASTALGGGTVAFDLASPSDGAVVAAGATIDWTIHVTASTGDNLGLGLAAVDLVQAPGNPELFDIPAASGVPTALADFSRPAGISNAGPGGVGTGFVGTQAGTAGQKNLTQIGGSQNTFGVSSATMGTDVNVDGSVAQGPGGELLAAGSFAAPATPGVYTFSLAMPIANTLDAINVAPQWSPVSAATASAAAASFSFTVCRKGDIDGDNILTADQDVAGFVALLVDSTGATDQEICAADMNGDGVIDGMDIGLFVAEVVP